LGALTSDEFNDVLWQIQLDLAANPGRADKSVVITAVGWQEFGKSTYESVRDAYDLQVKYANEFRDVMRMGVPIICAAGNSGGDIDNVPQLFADEDTPLIVVGAAGWDGRRMPFSQGGNQLTVHAPGDYCPLQSRVDQEEVVNRGTSAGKLR
jgi:hypothetical protein